MPPWAFESTVSFVLAVASQLVAEKSSFEVFPWWLCDVCRTWLSGCIVCNKTLGPFLDVTLYLMAWQRRESTGTIGCCGPVHVKSRGGWHTRTIRDLEYSAAPRTEQSGFVVQCLNIDRKCTVYYSSTWESLPVVVWSCHLQYCLCCLDKFMWFIYLLPNILSLW